MAEQKVFIGKLDYQGDTMVHDILLSDKSKLQSNAYRKIPFSVKKYISFIFVFVVVVCVCLCRCSCLLKQDYMNGVRNSFHI